MKRENKGEVTMKTISTHRIEYVKEHGFLNWSYNLSQNISGLTFWLLSKFWVRLEAKGIEKEGSNLLLVHY